MISGRRRVLAIAGAALIGSAMVGALLLSGGPKPVDVRQVQSSFGPEALLSATYTTSVLGVGPTTTPPPPPPAPPTTTREETTEAPPVAPEPDSTKPTRYVPPWLEELGGCDDDYDSDGVCVPWVFPAFTDGCEWLYGQGSRRIEVRGEDRHELDRNLDGIACGDGDR
jgi:hypothetical protein